MTDVDKRVFKRLLARKHNQSMVFVEKLFRNNFICALSGITIRCVLGNYARQQLSTVIYHVCLSSKVRL